MSRLFALSALLVSSAFAATAWADTAATATDAGATAAVDAPEAQEVPLEDIQTFAAIFRAVKSAYVEPVDDRKLMQDAIRGMLAGLDPHSEYLDLSGVKQLDEDTTGQYAGLGIEVLFLDGVLRVISPIDDSPASRAGIKSGDIILSIDGKPVVSEDRDAIQKLRGKPGSPIALSIAREGNDSPLEMTLRREVIRVASVKTRLLERDYAYVRVTQFQEQTGAELREKLRRLVNKNGAVRGVVLDLRSNPGGLLNAAVAVADAFLDEGTIVSTRGRTPEAASSFAATRGDLSDGAPLVVLVDAGTASAAEIVAGALKDNHRGLIIGQRTFGKGSVQSVLGVSEDTAVKLTTARYYTPRGISIQAAGIVPDIALKDLRLTRPDGPATLLAERDLPGHLNGELEGVADAPVESDEAVANDYALNEALNVLKGLVAVREHGKPSRG